MKSKRTPNFPKRVPKKLHATAVLLVLGEHGYAWVGHAMKLDVWERQPIVSMGKHGSADWNAAAFAACLTAYERLRKRVPNVDLSLCVANPPAGEALPMAEILAGTLQSLRKLIPEMLPPVTQAPKGE